MRVRWLLVAALLAACAKDPADLTPFPCAADQGCPTGTACLPGTGCTSPQADVVCSTDADCGNAGKCDTGRCSPPCSNGAGCASGRICSATTGAGVCLTSCTATAGCTAELSCEPLRLGGASACLPKGKGVGGACTGADGDACGPAGAGLACSGGTCQTACGGGAACPSGFVCSSATAGICLADCSGGQSCASGTACASLWYGSSKACITGGLGLDSACPTEGAACGPFGSNAICTAGVCVPKSDASGLCGSGRIGLVPGATGCLADCSTGSPCPSALTCNELWYSGKKGCTAKAPTACVQTQTPAGANNCLNRCGATYFTVPCGSGNCPEHSYCTPDNRCSCIAGYTGKTCTGTVCTGTCSYPNWACVPTVNGPSTLTCTDPPASAAGTCTCVDRRTITMPCAAAGYTCEYLCSNGCNPVTQDCRPASGDVCHFNGSGVPACLAPAGNLAVGQACTYTATADTCAQGADCDGSLSPAGQGFCRKLCAAASDCSGGACIAVSVQHTPLYGYCYAPADQCAPFSGCATGTSCDFAQTTTYGYVPVCHKYGTLVLGASCTKDFDCGANMECLTTANSAGATVCTMLCDASHACPGGLTCKAFGVQPYPAWGACQ
ncbi:MAG: hypothetical protein E6J88_14180 [Deltaproteobacteria bacterium]|nr:MAG: hypothetical protein E6J88_14180 [Deltaproteobacteria bacterium]